MDDAVSTEQYHMRIGHLGQCSTSSWGSCVSSMDRSVP